MEPARFSESIYAAGNFCWCVMRLTPFVLRLSQKYQRLIVRLWTMPLTFSEGHGSTGRNVMKSVTMPSGQCCHYLLVYLTFAPWPLLSAAHSSLTAETVSMATTLQQCRSQSVLLSHCLPVCMCVSLSLSLYCSAYVRSYRHTVSLVGFDQASFIYLFTNK